MAAACEDVRGIFKSITALKQSNVAGITVGSTATQRRELLHTTSHSEQTYQGYPMSRIRDDELVLYS